ncbi:calpain-12 isoform X1 [Ornithorhynchus anatinus]|uniref:calpain-12 isoform X1 n=1 Tax=Ornithorhynchus anatinus TaxID=9258 RepID=UPI0019D4B27B|nr:calpain-12 isoform X1 [Ornithorhynchus anatinus]
MLIVGSTVLGKEVCPDPLFVCEDMSRTDVCQGSLGNCWFLAAAASLTLYPRLLEQVVPVGQSFQRDYAGIFHFRLWQFGRWVDVVVDDRLPAKEGKLLFVRSAQRGEFWASLLEKAYAKLHGSYEVMRGGHMNEAFVDFTGGVGEVLYLQRDPPTPGLFPALRHALAKESLVGATALSDRGEYETEDGLVRGHAYSVTGTYKVSLGFTKVRLLRLRNPWGRVEWKGAWSDGCPRWAALPPEWREALLVKKEDGEFWMELGDFLRHFDTVQICSLSPEVLGPRSQGGGWHVRSFQGRWVRGFSAGGGQTHMDTFWTNPQFQLTLLEPDGGGEEEGPWGGWGAGRAWGPERGGAHPKCTVLVSLLQRNQRRLRARGLTYLTVGFHIFRIPKERLSLLHSPRRRELLPLLSRVDGSLFSARRDVSRRCRLLPGHYLLVPSTAQPGQEADFTLRVYTERRHAAMEIDDAIGADLHALLEMPYTPLPREVEQLFLEVAGEDEEIGASQLQMLLRVALEPGKWGVGVPRFPSPRVRMRVGGASTSTGARGRRRRTPSGGRGAGNACPPFRCSQFPSVPTRRDRAQDLRTSPGLLWAGGPAGAPRVPAAVAATPGVAGCLHGVRRGRVGDHELPRAAAGPGGGRLPPEQPADGAPHQPLPGQPPAGGLGPLPVVPGPAGPRLPTLQPVHGGGRRTRPHDAQTVGRASHVLLRARG